MDLQTWAKRLRKVADAIDEIFERPGTPKIAEAIRQRVTGPHKFKYHGKHWTQQPGNRARVVALAKARAKIRAAKRGAA